MVGADEVHIEARVTRYNIARFRLGQALVPVALIVTVVARRFPDTVPIAGAFIAQGFVAAAFLSAVRWLGWQPLRFERGAVWFGTTGLHAKQNALRDWTLRDGVVRIYGSDASFKLRVRPGGEPALEALLRGLFGRATRLKRRGSKRARTGALVVALAGLTAVVGSFLADMLALTLLGTPALIAGLATFGALSQRVRA